MPFQNSQSRPLNYFWCNRCGHSIHQSPRDGFCRTCGVSTKQDAQVFVVLAKILCDTVLGVEMKE